MRIAVIGAGIGGLSVAAGLKRAGADVTLFERTGALRASGSGLSVFANGARALKALGLDGPFEARTAASGNLFAGGQRRPDGRWLSRTPPVALEGLRIINREDLHDLLHQAVDGMPIHFHASASVVSGGSVRWSTGGGMQERAFHLIVAADGINSGVRRSLWGDTTPPRYAGYTAWRGITEVPVDLRGEAGETWGHGERFGIAPLRDGRVYWFAVASMPQDSRFTDEYAEVQCRFSHWHDPIAGIIATTRPGAVFRHDICDLAEPLSSFVRGNVVLLGDAAHAMTPDLGQGANQALEDAATLAALLAPLAAQSAPDSQALAQALQRYDEMRRPRTQMIARQARMLGAMAHARGRMRVAGRDLLMRRTPPRMLGQRLLALQAWEPPSPQQGFAQPGS